jgi:hypothetical protein
LWVGDGRRRFCRARPLLPFSYKPQTLMPNLKLADDEIEALIVFVNTEAERQLEQK